MARLQTCLGPGGLRWSWDAVCSFTTHLATRYCTLQQVSKINIPSGRKHDLFDYWFFFEQNECSYVCLVLMESMRWLWWPRPVWTTPVRLFGSRLPFTSLLAKLTSPGSLLTSKAATWNSAVGPTTVRAIAMIKSCERFHSSCADS